MLLYQHSNVRSQKIQSTRLGNLPLLEIAEESFPLVNNDVKNNALLSTQQFKIIKKSQPGTQVKVPLLGSTDESSPAINNEIVNNTLLSKQQYKITGRCPVTETINSTITSNSSEISHAVSDVTNAQAKRNILGLFQTSNFACIEFNCFNYVHAKCDV